MSKEHTKYNQLFGRSGTEGMLDVILACTLIFLLISCLIRVGQEELQEKVLPAVNLSKASGRNLGAASVKKNTITIKSNNGGQPKFFFDDKAVSYKELQQCLTTGENISHIALRRDNDIACKWEDEVIMLCRKAGINRVGIVIVENNQN